MRQTFEEWRQAADGACWLLAGCGLDDLPDAPYRDWYEDGVGFAAAARRAIRRAS